jgi:hypothetical protein
MPPTTKPSAMTLWSSLYYLPELSGLRWLRGVPFRADFPMSRRCRHRSSFEQDNGCAAGAPRGRTIRASRGAIKLTLAKSVPIASASLVRARIPIDRRAAFQTIAKHAADRAQRHSLKSLYFSGDDEHRFGQSSSLTIPEGIDPTKTVRNLSRPAHVFHFAFDGPIRWRTRCDRP